MGLPVSNSILPVSPLLFIFDDYLFYDLFTKSDLEESFICTGEIGGGS